MAAPSHPSPTTSRMMSSSPKGSKKSIPKVEEPGKADINTSEAATDAKAPTTNAPLAPPPKPQTSSDAPDYFSQSHSNSNPFSLEPNVFEQSFTNPSVETPGRTILPPVGSITSPSPLPGITPGWQSLRSGPLSPAMLTGPANDTDYFSSFPRGFPTPNESSLRTGLTPGGGGSMFPAPSPNTQALFNLQSGVATPSTADFQQSALRAAAQNMKYPPTSVPISQADTAAASMSQANSFQPPQSTAQQQRGPSDHFSNHNSHEVSSAASDLLSFATQNGTARNGAPQFAATQQPQNFGHMPVQPVDQEPSRRNTKGSINSIGGSVDAGDMSGSEQSEQKTNTRSRPKRGATTNGKQSAGNKRKADEPPKGNSRKKTTNGAPSMNSMDDDSEEETSPRPEDGKKMTDEEKRKNFLERNRVAALKCRQRKKQWLANLQSKVELYSTENDALSATVTQLREEIVNLKTVLLAHKDCPISVAQGISGMNMNNFLGDAHQNPYGIAQMAPNVQMGMPMQPGAQMQNRFVHPSPRSVKAEDEENGALYQNPYLLGLR